MSPVNANPFKNLAAQNLYGGQGGGIGQVKTPQVKPPEGTTQVENPFANIGKANLNRPSLEQTAGQHALAPGFGGANPVRDLGLA